MQIFFLLIIAVVIATIARGTLRVMELVAPDMRWKVRAILAGVLASAVPWTLFLIGLYASEVVVGQYGTAVIVHTMNVVVCAIFISIPVAYFSAKKRFNRQNSQPDTDIFE